MSNQSHFQVTTENAAAAVEAANEAHATAEAERVAADPSIVAIDADKPEEPEAPAESSETPDQAEETESETETADEAEEAEGEAEAPEGAFTAEQYQNYFNEFVENGDLGEESRTEITAKLEAAGLPPELLDEYLAGQSARLQSAQQAAFNIVGGEQQYTDMIAWARENLTPEQANAYDMAVANPQTAELAIKGLFADFRSARGNVPSMRTQGGTTQQGLAPIRSMHELMKLMDTDDYRNDPAFRADVERRLDQSQKSGQFRR